MVTEQTCRDNSWFQQPCFNSSLILTKIPNRRRTGYKTESLSQAYYQLPENFHCKLSDLHQGGLFIRKQNLQNLMRSRTGIQNYNLTEHSYSMLKNSLKFVIKNTKCKISKLCTSQLPKTSKILPLQHTLSFPEIQVRQQSLQKNPGQKNQFY